MNRWQHFYDLAAAQLAVTYAQTRNFDVAEKVAAAKRMAADAKAFADAFKAVEEAAFEPTSSLTLTSRTIDGVPQPLDDEPRGPHQAYDPTDPPL